jgi:hypothetical protein
MDDSPGSDPLTRAERLNVFFVLGVSQVVQVLTVAVLTAIIYFILGLIVLSPELRATWTHGGAGDGTLLGITIPVPDALIQVDFFLAALTFMYVSAHAVSDEHYRERFLDPLIDDLQVTLIARDRYRAQGLRCSPLSSSPPLDQSHDFSTPCRPTSKGRRSRAVNSA